MAKILVADGEFRITGVKAGDLLTAMREVGNADDLPAVSVWADLLACALRRRGVAVQLTLLGSETF